MRKLMMTLDLFIFLGSAKLRHIKGDAVQAAT